MKVGIVYTSTTPELIEDVNRVVREQLGADVEVYEQDRKSVV